ncbi:hypothetical protein P8841_09295 [Bacillus spizizenii]|nr:hypothetical protein [Bacillus spizizenii]
MAFFRSLDKQSPGAREFNEIILGLDGLSYTSVSAIKNSDVFTAVLTLSLILQHHLLWFIKMVLRKRILICTGY